MELESVLNNSLEHWYKYGESSTYLKEFKRWTTSDPRTWDLHHEDGIYVMVCPNPLGRKYIIVSTYGEWDKKEYCRLDMLKPEYIGYPDEKLILSEDNIKTLMMILSETKIQNEWITSVKPHQQYSELARWQYIIDYINVKQRDFKDELNFYVPLPMDLPIPDYNKL